MSDSVTPWPAARQASLSSTISQSLFKFTSIESVILSNQWQPLLLLPSIFPSIRVFSNEPALHIKWQSFSISISPSKGYSGLISFRTDWFDLLVVLFVLRTKSDSNKDAPQNTANLHPVIKRERKYPDFPYPLPLSCSPKRIHPASGSCGERLRGPVEREVLQKPYTMDGWLLGRNMPEEIIVNSKFGYP